MKRLKAIGSCSLLVMGLAWATSCGPAEWGERYIPGKGYNVYFQMPRPFTTSEGYISLPSGRTPFEHGYVTQGDDEHKFQIRTVELPVAAWQMDGFNRQAIIELGLARENRNPSDKILDRHDFIDPDWPENVNPAEELTIESADGKTIRHSRIVHYIGHDNSSCFVLLTATRPKDEPRSPDIDRFFKSFRICTGDERPGKC